MVVVTGIYWQLIVTQIHANAGINNKILEVPIIECFKIFIILFVLAESPASGALAAYIPSYSVISRRIVISFPLLFLSRVS